jgi:hypothetical protein
LLSGLHADGLIELIELNNREFLVGADFANALRADGLIEHEDACGKGWMPGGPGGKCKRVPKGTAKKVAAESSGIRRLGKSNPDRVAAIDAKRKSLEKKQASLNSRAEKGKNGSGRKFALKAENISALTENPSMVPGANAGPDARFQKKLESQAKKYGTKERIAKIKARPETAKAKEQAAIAKSIARAKAKRAKASSGKKPAGNNEVPKTPKKAKVSAQKMSAIDKTIAANSAKRKTLASSQRSGKK